MPGTFSTIALTGDEIEPITEEERQGYLTYLDQFFPRMPDAEQ